MRPLPTVRIMRDGVVVKINASDYRAGRDQIVVGDTVPPPAGLVAKVAGEKGIDSTDPPPTPDGTPVPIPDDWETLHWSQQEKLALEIVGGDGPLVPAEGQTRAAKARAIIAATVADRESRATA